MYSSIYHFARELADAVIDAKEDEREAIANVVTTVADAELATNNAKAMAELLAARRIAVASAAEAAFNAAKPIPIVCESDKRIQERADRIITKARRVYDNRIEEHEPF